MYKRFTERAFTALDYVASAIVYVLAGAVKLAKRFTHAAAFMVGNLTGAVVMLAFLLFVQRADTGPRFETAAIQPNTVGVPAPPTITGAKPAAKVEPVKREKAKPAPGKSVASKHSN